MTHISEPCGWTVDVCDDCCDDGLNLLPSGQVELVMDVAIDFLFNATGRRFSSCTRTYRPCRRSCGDFWGGLPQPYRLEGRWVNLTCGTCTSGCGCSTTSEVILNDVQAVTSVKIDGEELTPSGTVAVYDHSRIVRIDGALWPMCQDLSVIDGPGAWSITVEQGVPVPRGGDFVAGILACEMAKACANSDGCRLPKRVQSLTRQGVVLGFQDTFEGLELLRTGLYEVDAWIEGNRRSIFRQASISSPDILDDPPELTWPVL